MADALTTLWNEAQTVGGKALFEGGFLALDNSTLEESVPVPVIALDFRIYDVNADENGKHFTKNDHFRAMVSVARARSAPGLHGI